MTQNPDPQPEPKGYYPQEGCWPTLLVVTLTIVLTSAIIAMPAYAQSESVYLPLILKGPSQPHATAATGDLYGYTWIHHDGWTAPWCGGTHVLLVDYAGQIMDHQYVGCEQYHFPDLPMSGNPYTLFGLAVVPTEPEPMTFGRAVRNIKVQPDALTLWGLVMTSPATVLMLP